MGTVSLNPAASGRFTASPPPFPYPSPLAILYSTRGSGVIPTYRDGDRDDEFFTVWVGRLTEREPPRVSLEASPSRVHEGNTVNVRHRLSEAMFTDLTVPIIVPRIDS